jgi:2-polyprenyl-3-methyl-5-hydroxy-6-metoxy-1,4-benzoquinol methylase
MREIACPICDGGQPALVFAATLPCDFDEAAPPSPYAAHYRINRCGGCGLVYSSPVMDEQGVAALYRDSSETNVAAGEENNVRRTMAGYYGLAAPHVPSRDRILDIGCDMGFLLEVARKDGFAELHGLEPNPAARAVARRIAGAQIVDRFIEDLDGRALEFDLITMIHVLDHLVDPRIALARVHRSLRPAGVVVAVVHNVRSVLGRVLGERFPVYNLYHHFFFDKSTLAELFRRQGFEVIDVVSTRNCYSLGFFARRLPGCPAPVRDALAWILDAVRLAKVPFSVPVGNIAIVARRSTP